MGRTVGDGSRRNIRRYVWKKRSSADTSKSRYVLQRRQAASDWACIPQTRRGFEEPDPFEEHAAAQAPGPRRPGRNRVPRSAYDYGDYYYDAEAPEDDYEPDDRHRNARPAPARHRPAGKLDLRATGVAVIFILATVICGMAVESRFGVLSALIARAASSAAVAIGWLALVSPIALVGGGIAFLIGAWMIAKAVRLQRICYDEPAPRRRVLVSKETLDRYF